MNNSSVTRFVAFAIGALMIGNTLSNQAASVFSIEDLTFHHVFIMFLFPLFFNVAVACLLFSYAKRIDLQLESVGHEKLLYAGSKLLGFYLLAFGIPVLISGLGTLAIDFEPASSKALYWHTSVSAVVEIIIGCVLLFWTPTVIEFADRKPGV